LPQFSIDSSLIICKEKISGITYEIALDLNKENWREIEVKENSIAKMYKMIRQLDSDFL